MLIPVTLRALFLLSPPPPSCIPFDNKTCSTVSYALKNHSVLQTLCATKSRRRGRPADLIDANYLADASKWVRSCDDVHNNSTNSGSKRFAAGSGLHNVLTSITPHPLSRSTLDRATSRQATQRSILGRHGHTRPCLEIRGLAHYENTPHGKSQDTGLVRTDNPRRHPAISHLQPRYAGPP